MTYPMDPSTADSLSAGRLTVIRMGWVLSKERLKPRKSVLLTTVAVRAPCASGVPATDKVWAPSSLGVMRMLRGTHDVMFVKAGSCFVTGVVGGAVGCWAATQDTNSSARSTAGFIVAGGRSCVWV